MALLQESSLWWELSLCLWSLFGQGIPSCWLCLQKTEAQDQMALQDNSIKHSERSKCLSFKNSFKKLQRKGQTQSVRPPSFWYQSQMKTTQIKKGIVNITDEYRCKNPQWNFNKQNSTTHQKAHTQWSSWVYSREARILQYIQINQCDTPH